MHQPAASTPGHPVAPPATKTAHAPPARLLEQSRPPGAPRRTADTQDQDKPDREERFYLCRACRHPVTSAANRTERGGSFTHTVFNPYGVLFEIGTFTSAQGCSGTGPYVPDFTWFPSCSWRIGQCAGCGAHLGWHFHCKSGDAFWGLILPNLVVTGGGEGE
ncbi:MAG: hypothetical protein H0S85_02725 [Desulfovibrionaceae bacterium]|jgi:hypothetical protein|nr:hypothetical protein [Desulfovibrionaceae bacterium]